MTFELPDTWVLILVPLALIWVFVLFDIIRQTVLTTRAKWIWVALVTLLWPMLIAYWLTRPVEGRATQVASRDYPQARLVDGALDHEAGRIDDVGMAAIKSELRGHSVPRPAPRDEPRQS
jgi:hypothetical protein